MHRRATAVLAAGAVLIAAVVVVVLSQSGHRTLDSNRVGFQQFVVEVPPGAEACQPGELVPEGAGRVRVTIADRGVRPTPEVRMRWTAGERDVASATLEGGSWGEGRITAPLAADVDRVAHGATWCVANAGDTPVLLAGQPGDSEAFNAAIDGTLQPGRMRIDYLTRDEVTWWSQIGAVVDRFGVGKARHLGGSWVLWVALAALAGAVALAVRTVRRPPENARRLAAACGAVALLGALAWSLITPPFHVPDENAHFAYAQVLVEENELPRDQPGGNVPDDLATTLGALQFFGTIGNPENKPIRTTAAERTLRGAEEGDPSSSGTGEGLVAASQPPLYYSAAALAYAASPWDTVLDRLQLMRLVSVLLAGLTAFFAVLFVAEVFPRSRWAWAPGGLAVALFPLAGFISGGVNGDALLFTASAALFYALARILRRGLDLRTGLLAGVALMCGLLAKLTFIALVPMAGLGLAYAAWRGRRHWRPVAAGLGTAVLVAAVPFLAYRMIRDGLQVAAAGPPDPYPLGTHSTRELLSYSWQVYLPRMPFMTDLIPEVPPYNVWFVGLVGRFGWLDHTFPGWVNQLALVPFGGLLALAGTGAWRCRAALRRRLPEIAVYASGVAVLLAAIAYVGYFALKDQGQRFEQARYLLPLLALYGALVALAVKGAGRRWAPVAGAAIVVVAIGHLVLAQLLTLARYYG